MFISVILVLAWALIYFSAVIGDRIIEKRRRTNQLMRSGYTSGNKKASELKPPSKVLTKEEKEVQRLANNHAVAMLEVVNAAERAALIKAGRIKKPKNSVQDITDQVTATFDGASGTVEVTDDPDKPHRDWSNTHGGYNYQSPHYYNSRYDRQTLRLKKQEAIKLRDWLNSLTFDPIEDDLPQPFDFSLVPQNNQQV